MADLKDFILQVKDRLRVSDVVGQRVTLRRQGKELVGLSPFNSEKTPSFTVNDDKGFWHCFSSGKHGDAISFLQETQHLTFIEALEKVAKIAGMSLPKITAKESQHTKTLDTLRTTLQDVVEIFRQSLHNNQGAHARAYLKERGFSSAIIKRYHLGYVPRDNKEALGHLFQKCGSPEALVTLGIVKEGERGKYVPIVGRLFFPIHDRQGRPIAWGARVLQNDKGQYAKYLNAPEHPLFKKRECLYGQQFLRARDLSRKDTVPLVVEGYMDVLALAQAGYKQVVASMGTALTQEQLGILWREHKNPIVCFDGDAAGRRAVERLVEVALPFLCSGKTLSFRFVPDGKDPDLVIQQGGLKAFEDLGSMSFVDFVFSLLCHGLDRLSPESRALCFERLDRYVNTIKDQEMRYHYRLVLRQKIWTLLRERPVSTGAVSTGAVSTSPPEIRAKEGLLREHKPLKLLIGLMTMRPDLLSLEGNLLEKLPLEGAIASYRDRLLSYEEHGDDPKRLFHETLVKDFPHLYQEHKEIVESVYPHLETMDRSRLSPVCYSLSYQCYLLSLREHYKDLVEYGANFSMISTIEAEEAKILKEDSILFEESMNDLTMK